MEETRLPYFHRNHADFGLLLSGNLVTFRTVDFDSRWPAVLNGSALQKMLG